MSYLDKIRIRGGAAKLRQVFSSAARSDRSGAAALLNDDSLQFPVLFILTNEIERFGMGDLLTARVREALDLVRGGYADMLSADTLRWIVLTGADWDGPNTDYDTYDEIIDRAALGLSALSDCGVVDTVIDLAFRRNRRGLFMHDLVWCVFRCFRLQSLVHISKYLLSKNRRDFELACLLLHITDARFEPAAQQRAYTRFHEQLYENRPFLYLSGEHFQMTSEPEFVRADPEAKYLQREISPETCEPLTPLDDHELECLQAFRSLPAGKRERMSEYSHRLNAQDGEKWSQWMSRPIAEQVMAADMEWEAI